MLNLTLVIRHSDSLAGLPYEGEELDRSLYPTPERRMYLIEHNVQSAKGLGKWSGKRNEKFGVPEHSPDRPGILILDHRETRISYLVRVSVEVQEPFEKRYEECWPKAQPGMSERVLRRYDVEYDFLASIHLVCCMAWYPDDLEDLGPFADILTRCTTGHSKPRACLHVNGCAFERTLRTPKSEENTLAQARLEERYALYDRRLLVGLKTWAVARKWSIERRRHHNSDNLKCMNADNHFVDAPKTLKREAEDDQGDATKKRAIDVSGWTLRRSGGLRWKQYHSGIWTCSPVRCRA